jgi:hypothetical protein
MHRRTHSNARGCGAKWAAPLTTPQVPGPRRIGPQAVTVTVTVAQPVSAATPPRSIGLLLAVAQPQAASGRQPQPQSVPTAGQRAGSGQT